MKQQKLKAFIIEDDKNELKDLQRLLQRNFADQIEEIDDSRTSAHIDDATHKITELQEQGEIDLLFLDLLMYDTDESIVILEKLKEISFEIICITSHPELFERVRNEFGSYICGFVDKLARKDAKINQIHSALTVFNSKQKLMPFRIETNKGLEDRVILTEVKAGEGTFEHFIDPSEIMLIESDGNYKVFNLTAKEAKIINQSSIRMRLSWSDVIDFFKEINLEQFYQVHDGFIVNLSNIASYNRSDNLLIIKDRGVTSVNDKDNTRHINVGRTYLEKFRSLLNNFSSPK